MRKNQTRAGLGFFVVSALSVGALSFGATACDFVAGGKELDLAYCQAHPAEPACAEYCTTHSGAGCPDAPVVVTGCKAEPTKCVGAMPVCDTVMDKCVECTATSHDLCVGMAPVCGADESCRGCTQHSECASEVCLPDGSCAVNTDVAYVKGATGSGSACTQVAPCLTLTAAITAAKPLVKVKGATTEPAGIVLSGKTLRVFADAGASVSRNSAGAVIELATATTLELNELAIVDGLGANGVGVLLSASGANNQLTMNHATVRGCAGVGVKADGGVVTLTGTIITGNKGGGLSVVNGSFKLTNNIIAANGDADASSVGGVSLTSTANDNVFEQNTIVYNRSVIGNPGASCFAIASFHGRRNIITSNKLGITFPAGQSVGCADIESYTAAGAAANDLQFAAVPPSVPNFHLTAASPATVRDVSGVTACSGPDIDGDMRPQVGLCDFGADEYK